MESLNQDSAQKSEEIPALDKILKEMSSFKSDWSNFMTRVAVTRAELLVSVGERRTVSFETPVKSNAVVKYSSVLMPAAFAELRQNTDIKRPPTNWLSSFAERYGLNSTPVRTSRFSSFGLAHTFLDCVGDVNVVSDAENIKKLLKIPYSIKPVSMVVHRIENTLLIDEFDIHKHLLLGAENDWEWLRKYLLEHILSTLSSKENCISYQERSRNTLQQKSLVSKFLHYSLATTEENAAEDNQLPVEPVRQLQVPPGEPILPEPTIEDELPSASSDRTFNRNVVWTFEDIQMLLGTDMPIFGGPSRPCISLRLRDARKPISVLTGIDYWLDNLMSNVPEVVMCYHVDGIVQKYEILKTEDLPYLDKSRFSPSVIRDVAQNILSFLKANATKAGHTYWLFKGMNEDVVKLYDLTSLCSDSMNEKYENPFTIPVAMLLYRVARNMKSQPAEKSQSATLRTLLKNCLKLLPKELYPQIVTSVHFMLAELYIPPGTDPSDPEEILTCEELEDWENPEMDGNDTEDITRLAISELSMKSPYISSKASERIKRESPPPPITSLEERCKLSLHHVQEGLSCLRFFGSEDQNKRSDDFPEQPVTRTEESLKMAKPNEPIPMPFSEVNGGQTKKSKKKKKHKKQSSVEEKPESLYNCIGCHENDDSLKTVLRTSYDTTMPTWQTPENTDNESWKQHLGKILLKQACLVYSILYERESQKDRGGFRALNFVRQSLKCCGENRGFAAAMLRRGGTSLLTIADCIQDHRSRGLSEMNGDENMGGTQYPEVEPLSVDTTTLEYIDLVTVKSRSVENTLLQTVECFKKSFDLVGCSVTYKNLGSAYFALGVFNLNQCEKCVKSNLDDEESPVLSRITAAEQYFLKSLEIFKKTNEHPFSTAALGNLGKLYRIRAVMGGSNEVTSEKKHFYNKAFDFYAKALESVKHGGLSDLVENVEFDYATTWFVFAERHYLSTVDSIKSDKFEESSKQSISVIQKSVKFLETIDRSKDEVYQNLLGSLYLYLGNIFFLMIEKKINEKHYLQLCTVNFNKAKTIFENLRKPSQVIAVQNHLIKLSLNPVEHHASINVKKKQLTAALENVIYCKESLMQIANEEVSGGVVEENTTKALLSLQTLINNLMKAVLPLFKDKDQRRYSAFREAYGFALKQPDTESLASHLNKLVHILSKLTLN